MADEQDISTDNQPVPAAHTPTEDQVANETTPVRRALLCVLYLVQRNNGIIPL